METAPRDGSLFIGWLVSAGMGQPETMRWENGWRLTDGSLVCHVSHWTPCMKPPEDMATARKSGGETASDSRQGNVEQSHIRSSLTGTGAQ